MKYISKIFAPIALTIMALFAMSSTPTVYFIGDSTMADYDPTVYPNQRGWGQMFRNFIVGDMNFVNAARNGRSSRSFCMGADSLWAGVRTKLKTGDYVFIQFAHNDEKLNGLSDTAADGIATAPWSDYQDYLRKYVNQTRVAGATPVLVTPIIRCYFSGNLITEKGKHNLGTDDSTLNYVRAIKAVARELTVPLIDHTTMTCNMAESLGATNAYSTIYVTTDQTHLNPVGATLYAQLAVQDMLKQNILTANLNASPNLIITPGILDFGNSYISSFSSAKLTVSGLSLSPETGNITVTAPDGFNVGLSSAGAFSNTIDIAYTGSNLSATDIFVHFQPTQEKEYADSLSISYGQTAKKISVKGVGLSMSSGAAISVNFPLIANTTPVVNGPVICLDENWSGAYVKNYAAIANWPEGITATNVQRNSISATSSTAVDAWPSGEIDINTSRFIQFAVRPNAGTKLTIDSIGLYAGAAGGNGMKYRVLYSKNEDFSHPVTLEDKTSNTSNTMVVLSYKPMVQITEPEGFYLRFYPWYNGAASSKYLCLSNLTISGKAATFTAVSAPENGNFTIYPNPSTGIYHIEAPVQNSSIEVYDLTGVLVKSQKMNFSDSTIDLTGFVNGIYTVRFKSATKSATQLLIKK